MRTKLLMSSFMILLPAAFLFAVQWQLDSAPFEFPVVSVKKTKLASNPLSFSCRQLSNQKKVVLHYAIPSGTEKAFVHIYSINGVRVASLPLKPKYSRCVWNGTACGTYTAVLKAGSIKQTIRFVIAN